MSGRDSDEHGDNKSLPATTKESINTLLRRLSPSFALHTEGLGEIQGRTLTVSMAAAYLKRMPHPAHLGDLSDLSDLDVVRIFTGCAAGIPKDGKDLVSEPLTEEQAAKLTDLDIRRFAEGYLTNIAKVSELEGDPIPRMATLAREEHARLVKSTEKLGQTIQNAVRSLSVNADIMTNWKSIRDNFDGSITNFAGDYQRMLGASEKYNEPLQQAIKSFQRDQDAISAAVAAMQIEPTSALWGPGTPKIIEPPPPEVLEFGERPDERTAKAVEGLKDIGDRLQEGMELVLKQAASVSTLVSAVSTTIQNESKGWETRTEKQTRSALSYAKMSLAIAALALAASAFLGWLSYDESRRDAASQAIDSKTMITTMQSQSREIGSLIDQQKDLLEKQIQSEGDRLDRAINLQRLLLEQMQSDAKARAKERADPRRKEKAGQRGG